MSADPNASKAAAAWSWRASWSSYWRGLVMGASDVVPGVSGGTMALVLGIYPRLIAALASLTRPPLWQALRRGAILPALRAVDAGFLATLGLGIATAVIALAGLIEGALESAQPLVYATFFGLIAASMMVVARQVPHWTAAALTALTLGALIAFGLVLLLPVQTPTNFAFLTLTGAIGISALILPGVSGAYLLLLLGQYQTVLGAIARGDLATLLPFALGAIVGLLSFARLLNLLLRRYPTPTHALLAGFLAGSLPKVWPWQGASEALTLLPPSTLLSAFGLMLVALASAALVLGLHHRALRSASH